MHSQEEISEEISFSLTKDDAKLNGKSRFQMPLYDQDMLGYVPPIQCKSAPFKKNFKHFVWEEVNILPNSLSPGLSFSLHILKHLDQ